MWSPREEALSAHYRGLHPGLLIKFQPPTDMEIHMVVPIQHVDTIVCSDPSDSGRFSVV